MSEDLAETLRLWAKEASQRVAHCPNEESTKFGLIAPFFHRLGYDSQRSDYFLTEARAGSATCRFARADFAIRIDDDIALIVECKKAGSLRDKHADQLARYVAALPSVSLGVLTDGLTYYFFARSKKPDEVLSANPIMQISMEAIASEGISAGALEFLTSITAKNFVVDAVEQFEQRALVQDCVEKWWRTQINAPTDDFCRMVLGPNDFGRLTGKKLNAYRALIADAFLRSLAIKVKSLLTEARVDRAGVIRMPSDTLKTGSITTEREYEVFRACNVLLASKLAGTPEALYVEQIKFQDYDEHFAIYLGGVRKGLIVKFVEDSIDAPKFLFKDGRTANDFNGIEVPLIDNFRNAVKLLMSSRG